MTVDSVTPLNANYHSKDLNTNVIPLALGDMNVVVVTDVHSWVGGHGSHSLSPYNADYGDVLSFVERLRRKCKRAGNKDVFFVMNGDYVDGTGLGAEKPPSHLVEILRHLSWDALTVGNHELYYNETAAYADFRSAWGPRYVTSNVVLASNPDEPLGGSRYTILEGQQAGSKLLVFGFLYDMMDASPLVQVQPVEEVVEQDWFTEALSAQDDDDGNAAFDAILVLAHMGVHDPLVDVLLKKIRSVAGHHVAVQFITGHTHFRRYAVLDKYATSFEAGKYLDTVGFASFPRHTTIREVNRENNETVTPEQLERDESLVAEIASQFFAYTYLDANKDVLWEALQVTGEEEEQQEEETAAEESFNFTTVVTPHRLSTHNGKVLSNLIATTQESLGFFKVVGCSPAHYFVDPTEPVMALDSLWGLFVREVWTQTPIYAQAKEDKKPLYIQTPGNLRYDLWEGTQTVNDVYGVSPYNDTVVVVVSSIRGSRLVEALGSDTPNVLVETNPGYRLPPYIVAGLDADGPDNDNGGRIDPDALYNVYSGAFDYPELSEMFRRVVDVASSSPPNDNDETKLFPPYTPVQVDNVEWTNTYMWQRFMEDQWPCPNVGGGGGSLSPPPTSSSSSGPSEFTQLVGTFAFCLILLFLGCYGGFYLRDACLRRRHKARLSRDRLLQLAPRRGRAAPTLVMQEEEEDDDDDEEAIELERPPPLGSNYNKVLAMEQGKDDDDDDDEYDEEEEDDDEDDDEVVFANGEAKSDLGVVVAVTTNGSSSTKEDELGGVHTPIYETGAQIT